MEENMDPYLFNRRYIIGPKAWSLFFDLFMGIRNMNRELECC